MQTPGDPIESNWQVVESVNTAMHNAARNGDWLEVLELASRRHTLLQEHFTAFPVGPDNADFYRRHMDRLLRGEQELQATVRNARKSLMSEGLQTQHKNRAVGAYLNTATR